MNNKALKIPQYALHLMTILEENSISSWVVGGYIRDAFLNRASHDIDLATSVEWQKTEEVCQRNGLKVFQTGTQHGTVSVQIDGQIIEVTTLRKESTYSDFRHPDEVIFTDSIEEDLQRRDITINAIAYNPKTGLVDPFGGLSDLDSGIIRAVGDPRKRFTEDPLRILRILRFAATLGFKIETETAQAAHESAYLLKHIAKERIHQELTRTFEGTYFYEILPAHAIILAQVLPSLTQLSNKDFIERFANLTKILPENFIIRMTALIHEQSLCEGYAPLDSLEAGIDEIPNKCLDILSSVNRELRLSRKERASIASLLSYMSLHLENSIPGVQRALSTIRDPELFRQLLVLKRAQANLENNSNSAPNRKTLGINNLSELDQIEKHFETVISNNLPYLTSHLDISGTDLIEIGFNPDQSVGNTLNSLLFAVISGQIVNNRKNLLNFSKKFKNSVDGLRKVP